ncbi:MAG: hypothetical protein SPL50_05575 [Alloprevotella sp.]|nr:hypothetical protein [Alloprevotella sp.]MDY6297738.1 hypothetical protein [Alloprevotella sp.]
MEQPLRTLASPREETLSLLRLFAHSMPACRSLDDDELLTFFPGQPVARG